MRTVTEEFTVYTFKSANAKIRDKIRYQLGLDIYSHAMNERVATLVALAKLLNCKLDYELSPSPFRGERITMSPIESYADTNERFKKVKELNAHDCPLTGSGYDSDILLDIAKMPAQAAFQNYIDSIHSEYESMLTDEYLLGFCEANGYEFTEDGKIYI